jgi:hypothetical protein
MKIINEINNQVDTEKGVNLEAITDKPQVLVPE